MTRPQNKIFTTIRFATIQDRPSIGSLLVQLGYPGMENFLDEKIKDIIQNPNAELLVGEQEGKLVAFIAIAFIPQLGVKGDFARISYFAVDHLHRNMGIGKLMEQECTGIAIRRGCDRIEVHCHQNRKDAHRFYQRQGYSEAPKYLVKNMTPKGRI